MKKYNKKKIITLILMSLLFVFSLALVIYDLTIIVIKLNAEWTLFGILTFLIAAIVAELSYEYLEDKIKDTGQIVRSSKSVSKHLVK